MQVARAFSSLWRAAGWSSPPSSNYQSKSQFTVVSLALYTYIQTRKIDIKMVSSLSIVASPSQSRSISMPLCPNEHSEALRRRRYISYVTRYLIYSSELA